MALYSEVQIQNLQSKIKQEFYFTFLTAVHRNKTKVLYSNVFIKTIGFCHTFGEGISKNVE